MTTAIEKNQKYDLETLEVMERILNKKSNCVDIGCHVGSVLVEMIRLAPEGKHYAFEPIPEMYDQLVKSFKIYPNVNVHGIALSETAGESTFQHVVSNPGYSGLRRRKYERSDEEIKKIIVRTDRLDNFIPNNVQIHFIKIDVEGAELQVFKGAIETLKNNRPIIVFEHGHGAANYYETTPGDVYDLLAGECSLKISLMERWLRNQGDFDKDQFVGQYMRGENYYFIAHP